MEYRSLGRTGVMVSPIGLGSDNFGDATSAKDAEIIINRALEAGINLIDTGDIYCEGESERIIGRTISNNKKRDHVIIATKVDHAVDGSVYRLMNTNQAMVQMIMATRD